MGGIGSTRWQGHPKRPLVEDSFILDCTTLSRAGVLDCSETMVKWELEGEKIASVAVGALKLPNGRRELLVAYKAGPGKSAQIVAEAFALESVPMGVAGPRLFLRCPHCGERACKLYLPPNAQHFRCLKCSGATHLSAQTHDIRVDRLRRGDPETVRWALARLRRVRTYGSFAWSMLVIEARCGTPNRARLSSATVTFHNLENADAAQGAPTREAASG